MKAIEVKDLSKTFKSKTKEKGLKGSIKSMFKPKYNKKKAVNNISFSVERGEVLAFIGPNGAGKSTTIKMLTGILYPTKGEVTVMGVNPQKQRRELAYKIGTAMRILKVNKNDAGQRLDKFLTKSVKGLPTSLMYKYIRTKKIKVNRARADLKYMLVEGR